MRSLTALPDAPTYLARYIAIRDKKHKATRTTLVASHAVIAACYEDYARAIASGALTGLVSNAQAAQLSAPLRACYDSPTQPLKDLKQAIHNAQSKRLLKYCPMCGTTLPKTFDHYMPAVKFPEFAVHPLNLVPCCATCNSIKDADWLSAAGGRQYLHTYSDNLPDLQFVLVTLHQNAVLQGVGATFSLERPLGIPNALWLLIKSHFTRLKLIDRYEERGSDEIAEILSDCRIHLEAGGSEVRTFLQGRADDRKDIYGRNHWIAVLMDAMAKHPDLVNWVNDV
ncbi:hypothetical protein VC279_06540 [Xanthomonas sp. WHRI 10064A]|uniref:hypothetical protein n=1 Tax=unclassified Xanthomonas TaxID=2643310 RepID=UPI002B233DE3|nr:MULTISPECIES: hypothetical protein [unclassified Xanthomonas]MEA9585970.1 hypothetical protein [Xanthomonas sp. WHRI 10064B]MEA9614397.1 hypothetical protein [Xanthomonas sp. WHRI 10064A]